MGIKKLGPGRYQVRVNRVNPKTGRKVNRKTLVSGTLDEARTVEANLRAEVVSTVVRPSRIRLGPYAHSWLERQTIKASTRRAYGCCLINIVRELGDYFVDSLTPPLVQAYVTDALTKRGPQTVRSELVILRILARDIHAEGHTQRMFTDRIRSPKVPGYTLDDPNLFTPAQFAATFAKLPERWRGLVMLLVTTGMRWGEATALHWEDIHDVSGETLAVVRYTNDRGTRTPPKNEGSYRLVPLLPEVLALLNRRATGPLFVTRKGTLHKSQSHMLRVLTTAERAVGLPFHVTLHGLRRTFNNEARKRTPREVLMSLTGHDTHEMVEHYSVVAPAEMVAAARGVLTAIQSVPTASRDDEQN